ncbi:MAG: coproporphyrinogen III oxidase, partial [Bacillota bacterium]|nr:coproporphyrinogen III oxidase [Bacillota bacterium]
MKDNKNIKDLGLYIHIPFCQKKCNYCDFYSVCDLSSSDEYLSALFAHIKQYGESSKPYNVDSLYIGGGTPTVLTRKQIKNLFK